MPELNVKLVVVAKFQPVIVLLKLIVLDPRFNVLTFVLELEKMVALIVLLFVVSVPAVKVIVPDDVTPSCNVHAPPTPLNVNEPTVLPLVVMVFPVVVEANVIVPLPTVVPDPYVSDPNKTRLLGVIVPLYPVVFKVLISVPDVTDIGSVPAVTLKSSRAVVSVAPVVP